MTKCPSRSTTCSTKTHFVTWTVTLHGHILNPLTTSNIMLPMYYHMSHWDDSRVNLYPEHTFLKIQQTTVIKPPSTKEFLRLKSPFIISPWLFPGAGVQCIKLVERSKGLILSWIISQRMSATLYNANIVWTPLQCSARHHTHTTLKFP